MSVTFVNAPPKQIEIGQPAPAETGLRPGDVDLRPGDVEHIAEIFRSPLTGSYNWDYEEADRRLRKLYKLGKERNWDADLHVDWSVPLVDRSQSPVVEGFNPFEGFEPFEKMAESERVDFAWHEYAWMMSQFMHGEQGALLVASQLVSCAPTYDAKMYAASQTFDEARHVEVFKKYLRGRVGIVYPVNKNLKALLDKILGDPRWDLKFIGMQLIIESLALAAFQTQKMMCVDPVMRQILDLVMRDESRHVAFGVTYMEEFVKSLPPEEIEARAQFAYEACLVMRERIIGTDVMEHFGWDAEEGRRRVLDARIMAEFRRYLFSRIIPNLKKVGPLTDSVRPKYDALGVLEYENLADDGQIDWVQMEAPIHDPVAAE
jgi:hypothetical protein